MSSATRTIRLTTEEDRVLRRASDLLEQPTSQFVQAGVVEAAHRLGFYAGVRSIPVPYQGTWPDVPERGDESTSKRTCFTFEPHVEELLHRAADYVQVGESFFILGATFRYLANLRQTDSRIRRLKLPEKFERSG